MEDIMVKYFDTVPVSTSLCVLKTGFLFVASEFSNHYLFQFQVSNPCWLGKKDKIQKIIRQKSKESEGGVVKRTTSDPNREGPSMVIALLIACESNPEHFPAPYVEHRNLVFIDRALWSYVAQLLFHPEQIQSCDILSF